MFTTLKALTILAVVTMAAASGDVIGDTEAICGTDQSLASVALKDSETTKYQLAQAVARLKISGGWCTAWLWGSEGHLVTNNHCIGSAADAATAIAEFGAECATATDPNNGIKGACVGTYVSNSSTLIITDPTLDFTLVKLNVNHGINITQFGYLQARDSAVHMNDPIYITGHPGAKPKRITYLSDDGKSPRITNTSTSSLCGEQDTLAYNVDTEGGSSGSPILGALDNKVVALHNCGGCTATGGANTGNKIELIIKLLKSKNLLPKDAVAGDRC
ncbi:hypothetical protein H257_18629 [Aphanomyces astaci]|uniref:Serine protease n=1 Tax=Aphanomyces astaci TaxID=112090 RepID=W4FAG0_APHAT|nr:hypothetical protein H257_18629 [Aphanomyces astaci]ETV64485.1 hypothetical protein H257_18629 [Aphanomyces astaci]|eukprot:XP_009846025.1 hypothetical protein H257_18629 [Aphanomyces astaci]